MQSRLYPLILIVLVTLTSAGLALDPAAEDRQAAAATDANQPAVIGFPYVAQVTGNRVNIRSGPGTNYYTCGKLNKTDRVIVVGTKFSWSQIVPTQGSFSWISKEYVSTNPDKPAEGTVTADNVRVYAGAEGLKPMHSTSVQLKHNKNEKVKLLGEEKDGYYKIAPPEGAYLWILSQYTKPLGAVGEIPVTVEQPQSAVESGENRPAVVTTSPAKPETLKEYYVLQKQFETERAKPIRQQNYEAIKKALGEIAADKQAGNAARYAEYTLGQIKRCELAQQVAGEVELQDKQLQRAGRRIEKALTARLTQLEDLGRFAVIGRFQTSNVYDSEGELKYYRIIDDSGNTSCYALPSGSAKDIELSEFVGRKVGLVGIIEPHQQTKGALVCFTEITELK